MSLIFVHLSDIHFGQEKGGLVHVHNDVKEELISDVRDFIPTLDGEKAEGIIISGDIAFAGKKEEYDTAGAWLDRVAAAAGCDRTSVQLVPGNHDVDLSKVSHAADMMIAEIAVKGDQSLNKFLESKVDREVLYNKFSAYQTFAAAYDCPLDGEGAVGGHREYAIAPEKFLVFHGVNTSLLCSKDKEEEGKLLLGQRQRVLPNQQDREMVVIAHHPLHWLQDSEDAKLYLKNRALIFISGHEHKPSHTQPDGNEGRRLLSIASGATVPPQATDQYTYCYNVLDFSWDNKENKLSVKIHPRIWDNSKKSFVADEVNFTKDKCDFALECPNFKNTGNQGTNSVDEAMKFDDRNVAAPSLDEENNIEEIMVQSDDQLILLKFFRDLSSSQRLSVLIDLEAIPSDLTDVITHAIEIQAIRRLFASGKSEMLKEKINLILSPKIN